MIFFTTGLLTLLAFSNAGGDHIKGGGHIKGVDHIKGGGVLPSGTKTVPQAIVQEEAIPSPYSFNIKTGAAYGTKVTREEVGDAEGRVKGTYTVSSPRGATRVVQYQADDTGFHANIKTSEPNIKTHSPSNAQIEAIPIKGGSVPGVKTVQVPDELVGKIHRTAELPQAAAVQVAQSPVLQATDPADSATIKSIKAVKTIKSVVPSGSNSGKTRFSLRDSQLREPTARPVVKEPVVAAIKSAPVLVTQQNIKTVVKKSDPSKIRLTQQRFSPLDIPVISKGSDILAEGIQSAPFTDGAKEIIVYEDGTTVEVRGSNILGQDLPAFTGQDLFVSKDPIVSYSQGERGGSATTFRAGSINKIKPVQVIPKAAPSTQIFPNPQRTAGTPSQLGLNTDIVNLNRQLQKQSEEELKRTLAGIVNVDTNLQSASLSDKELADIARRMGSGAPAPIAPAPQQRRPDIVQRIKPAVSPQRVPVATRPQDLRAGIDQKVRYTAGRVTAGGIQGGTRRVTASQVQGSRTVDQDGNVFILGNAPGVVGTLRTGSQGIRKPKPKVSPQALVKPQITMGQALPQPGFGVDIAELNRQLQTQGEEELKRTLAGIVNVDANIQGASLSEKELADISRRIGSGAPAPIVPAPQQRRPDIVQRIKPALSSQRVPVAPRPQVVGAGIDQKVKYNAGRVTAGGIQGGSRRITAGQIRGSGAVGQGENVFFLGNAPGAVDTLRAGIPKPKQKVSPQALPKPQITTAQAFPQSGFGADITELNKQIQMQSEEELKRTFAGIVNVDANIQVSSQALPKPQITMAQALPQPGLGADIAELNRQLQMQSEEELKRTLAGIVNVDANIQGASLSEKELADISRRIGSGAPAPVVPAPQQRRPDIVQRIKPAVTLQRVPVAPRPQVVGSGIDQKVKYTAGRVTASGIQGGNIRVPSGQIRGSSAVGQGENVFLLGNSPGAVGTLRTGSQGIPMPKPKVSPQALPKPQITMAQALPQPGLGADIAELNRQLQMQSEEELKRTLAGIVNVDANIQGASLSEKELADISRRIGSGAPAPVVSAPQQRRPDTVQRIKPALSSQRVPVAPRQQVVGAGIDQNVKYNAGRVTAGGIQGGSRRFTAGQIRGSGAVGQGENVFILGNAPGAVGTLRTGIPKPKPKVSPQALPKPQITVAQAFAPPGLGANIVQLNRQLQMQNEEELKRTLAGIVNVDANIQGASLSDKELADISRRIGSGAPAPVAPSPRQRRPDQIQRIKPAVSQQRVPVAPRPQVVGSGIDQKVKYTAGRVTASGIQGGNIRVPSGQIRGGSAVGQGENVFILGNAPGAVETLRTGSQGIPRPKPKVSPQSFPKPQITVAEALPQPGLGADIVELNRQLQMQSEEELKRTLAGIINVDANIQGASLSDKELADISRRIGSGAPAPVVPAPQQRRPEKVQSIKPQRVPVATRPQVLGAGIDQKVKYTAGRITAGGIQGGTRGVTSGAVRGNIAVGQGENVFILGNDPSAVGTLRAGNQAIPKPKPKVSPQALPKPQITIAQALPQPGYGADIVELNRQLQMQSEEELKRTLSGIVNVDSNIQGTSLSDKELADISRRIGSGVSAPLAPAPQQRKPAQVLRIKPAVSPQILPVAPRPQVVGAGIDQNVKYTAGPVTAGGMQGGTRRVAGGQISGSSATGELPESGLSDEVIQINRLLMQKQNEDELRQMFSGVLNPDLAVDRISLSAEDLKDISRRFGADMNEPVLLSTPLSSRNQASSRRPGSQEIASSSLTRTSSDAFRQRFGSGVMKVTDEGKRGNLRVTSGNQQLNSKVSGAAVTAQLFKDGQQILGQDRIETPIEIQQNVEPNFPAVSTIKIASNKITQVKESSNKFSPVEQSKVAQTILVPSAPVSQAFQSAVNNDDVNQLQVKVDDVIEQSRLPKADTIKQISNRPPVQSKLALESFSQKYLQEKVPVTIPGYVPPPSFMSPFNYRVPHIRTPIMQQQERLDQILV
ncbi:ATP-grasp domain-containing protein [Trichonephila inaurata madagascariensis]|uniref:ATP-grasp domain-containing protein n=1 Tax=Trichonephila inaurata madagascariensis TaxID=2747483 RepID=A0A8X6MLM3_9ARAC|nr:ATP-grasp domain-containing protein [Trichonephila inaurata madagascariensis]